MGMPKGFKHTKETINKMKIAHKGKASRPKGWKHSEETKRKMSEIAKEKGFGKRFFGKHHSEEARKQKSLRQIGNKHTEKSKEKMRQSALKRVKEGRHNWYKGGRRHSGKYIRILIRNHPFCDKMGYVFEHRLIVEQQIGRYLKPEEEVHHLGKEDDNRPQMLMAFVNHSAHMKFENGQSIPPPDIIFDGRNFHVNG